MLSVSQLLCPYSQFSQGRMPPLFQDLPRTQSSVFATPTCPLQYPSPPVPLYSSSQVRPFRSPCATPACAPSLLKGRWKNPNIFSPVLRRPLALFFWLNSRRTLPGASLGYKRKWPQLSFLPLSSLKGYMGTLSGSAAYLYNLASPPHSRKDVQKVGCIQRRDFFFR